MSDTTSPAYRWARLEEKKREDARREFLELLAKSENKELIAAFEKVKEVNAYL